jgi:hypothetical protein
VLGGFQASGLLLLCGSVRCEQHTQCADRLHGLQLRTMIVCHGEFRAPIRVCNVFPAHVGAPANVSAKI